jgi:hypothetical protein
LNGHIPEFSGEYSSPKHLSDFSPYGYSPGENGKQLKSEKNNFLLKEMITFVPEFSFQA